MKRKFQTVGCRLAAVIILLALPAQVFADSQPDWAGHLRRSSVQVGNGIPQPAHRARPLVAHQERPLSLAPPIPNRAMFTTRAPRFGMMDANYNGLNAQNTPRLKPPTNHGFSRPVAVEKVSPIASRNATSSNNAANRDAPSNLATANDRELLCIFNLYVSSFVALDKELDLSDRLLFFVPLIIIYWHHRHPQQAFPFMEIDGILRDIGQEGRVHRLALQDLVKRLEAHECRDGGAVSGRSNTSSSGVDHQLAEQANALEALRVLKSWLDNEERQANAEAELEARQTAGHSRRQVVHWFKELLGRGTTVGGNSARERDRGQASPAPASLATTTRPLVADATATSSAAPIMAGGTASPRPEVTTEPFGWPHYENRTDGFHVIEKAIENSTVALLETNRRNMPDSRAGASFAMPNSEIGDTTPAPAPGQPPSGNSPAAPGVYGEFFYLATRMLSDMNNNQTDDF